MINDFYNVHFTLFPDTKDLLFHMRSEIVMREDSKDRDAEPVAYLDTDVAYGSPKLVIDKILRRTIEMLAIAISRDTGRPPHVEAQELIELYQPHLLQPASDCA